MATNRDLLKEAIADAKSVKEVAIANAKLALEEAFTPHLKSMLAAKLDEMDKKDDEVKEAKEEEVKEADAPSFERKNSPAGDSLKDLAPRKVGQSTVQEDEVEEEINLDELLAELEDSKDIDEAKKDDDKDDIKEDERTDAEEEGYEDGMEDEKEDMDDEDVDLEDMSEDDLKGFIEDVIKDMVADGEIEPGDEFVEDEVEVEDSIDIEDVEDVDVDVEIDEEMKASEENSDKVKEAKVELDEMSKKEKAEGDDRKKDDKIEAETEKMRFKEALDEINALKVELNEVNLLNAKLLYTNKIFKAKNLTEGKKVKVLKAFDKAKDVRQAKTIFETLLEGLLDKSPINESIKRGSASKASGLEPKAKKQPIIESNDVYNRMRKLAGLI